MGEIVQLEQMNLIYDTMRQGMKFSAEVDPAAKVLGSTFNEMFSFYGNLRDANNRTIDQLLGQAASAAAAH